MNELRQQVSRPRVPVKVNGKTVASRMASEDEMKKMGLQ